VKTSVELGQVEEIQFNHRKINGKIDLDYAPKELKTKKKNVKLGLYFLINKSTILLCIGNKSPRHYLGALVFRFYNCQNRTKENGLIRE